MSIKVSTIIPVYNGERTIALAIDSALAQDYEDHEIIVVDDGSTDSTLEILKQYGDRVRILPLSNGGPARARNAGVAASTGKYLAFLDADDIFLPSKITKMIATLQGNPAASLAFSESRYIDVNGIEYAKSSLGRAPSMEELLTPRPLPIFTSTWMLSRVMFDQVSGFNERFLHPGFEDTWMLVLLRELGEFVYIAEPLTFYRVHDFVTADKYGPGLPVFLSLLREHFGAKGKRWIRTTKRAQCRPLLSKVAHQMNRGDKLGALNTLSLIFRLWPGYFLRSEFIGRMFAPQNARRLWRMITLLPNTRS